jgi:predicted nuclease of predicted toxin-antitoxin system
MKLKLLFDQNLSPRLVQRLADIFPGSSHVFLLALDQADDLEVWAYAREHDYVVVTKDADFGELSTLHGFPPQVVWLRVGNCTTNHIEQLLREHQESIERLAQESTIGILSIF